jgi:transcription-repair coupling factor (superfamily II helicase)
MHLPVSYKIPQTYVASTNRRLALYKEFFDADDLDEVEALSKKTTDMFGSFPEQVRLLIELAKVRVALREIRVQTVRYKEPGICILKFYALDEKKLHKLIHIGKEKKSTFAVGPDMRLFINAKSQPGATVDSQTSFCTELLHSLRTLKKKLK